MRSCIIGRSTGGVVPFSADDKRVRWDGWDCARGGGILQATLTLALARAAGVDGDRKSITCRRLQAWAQHRWRARWPSSGGCSDHTHGDEDACGTGRWTMAALLSAVC